MSRGMPQDKTEAAQVHAPVSTRQKFTLTKAAEVTGLSRDTIKRKRTAGAFPNAEQDRSGWLIPLEDLLAAGLKLNAPAQVQPQAQTASAQVHAPGQSERIAQLERELIEARAALRVAQVEHQAAERVASERERRAETAERALLMLEAGTRPAPTAPAPVEPPTPPAAEPVQEKPRSWWRRGRD